MPQIPIKVLEKCTKNRIGHSRSAFNKYTNRILIAKFLVTFASKSLFEYFMT